METVDARIREDLNALIDEYRTRCLWFLREGYYPATTAEALSVLVSIERYGDVEGFRRTAKLKQWLSRHSSGSSVD